MEQIVARILEAEKEAEGVLQQARAKAAEVRSQADAQSEEHLKRAREEAHSRVQAALQRVRDETEQSRRQALERIEQDNSRFIEAQRETIQRTADRVLQLLLQPEFSAADPADETSA